MELETTRSRPRSSTLSDEPAELLSLAYRAREHCIAMSARGGCFLGAALSAVDVLAFLYGRFLNVAPESFHSSDRDYFLLSKGHAVPALYGVLAERGFFDARRLERHLNVADSVYWHPNRDVKGVDFHTGSLGHAISVGAGIALDVKLKGRDDRVVVMLGDGELDEGSIWEGLLFAAARGLDNLILVVDRNGIQANERTEALVPLESLEDKFRAFGADFAACDGHSFSDLAAAFARTGAGRGRPLAVAARTVRGKGLPSIENRVDAWFVKTEPSELSARRAELRAFAHPRALTAAASHGAPA